MRTQATDDDIQIVTQLLGRAPMGVFAVVVRNPDGAPVVIRNEPLLNDGTPMPTLFWLVDPILRREIGRLEAEGGVRRAELECDPDELTRSHDRYRQRRDERIPVGHDGPRPYGGVGGTRKGVKCLHAHYAWFLLVGDDPVGRWVHRHLTDTGNLDSRIDPRDFGSGL